MPMYTKNILTFVVGWFSDTTISITTVENGYLFPRRDASPPLLLWILPMQFIFYALVSELTIPLLFLAYHNGAYI